MPTDFKFVYGLFAASFGLLIGSFLNACIYRLPRDLSVVSPRSFCPACETSIGWYDNIPVISYLVLRGRCRNCQARITWRYPLVEIATAILFAFTAATYGFTLLSFKWFIFESLLIALFFTDLEVRLLPDELTLGGLVAGLLFALVVPVPGFAEWFFPQTGWRMQSLMNAGMGAALLSGFAWSTGALFTYILKRQALGFGDVKLLASIGAFLGLEQGISAMLIASLCGSFLGVAYILWKRENLRSYPLPFGTFCCAGAAIMPFLSIGSHLSGAVR